MCYTRTSFAFFIVDDMSRLHITIEPSGRDLGFPAVVAASSVVPIDGAPVLGGEFLEPVTVVESLIDVSTSSPKVRHVSRGDCVFRTCRPSHHYRSRSR